MLIKKGSVGWFINYVATVFLLFYLFLHWDSFVELFDNSLKVPNDPYLNEIAENISDWCGGDKLCSINKITEWAYQNITINQELEDTSFKMAFYDFSYDVQDILKNGGVCRHKARVSVSMARHLGIDCKLQIEVVINDGFDIGHEWFECKVNNTTYVCDPTYYTYCYPEN